MLCDTVSADGREVLSQTQANMLRLRELANDARSNIYERCRLASEILSDREWIASFHNDDYCKAQKTLEDDFFFDLAGFISLGELVAIFRMFSDEKDWQDVRYRIGAMHAKWEKAREAARQAEDNNGPPKKRNCATVAERDDLRSQLQHTKNALAAIIGADKEATDTKPSPAGDGNAAASDSMATNGGDDKKDAGSAQQWQTGLREVPRRTLVDKVEDMMLALSESEYVQLQNRPRIQKRNKKLKIAMLSGANKKRRAKPALR